jgi:hypothetical protein
MADTMVDRARLPQGVWACPSSCPRKGELTGLQTQTSTQPGAPTPAQAPSQVPPANEAEGFMRAAEAARAQGNEQAYRDLVILAARSLVS